MWFPKWILTWKRRWLRHRRVLCLLAATRARQPDNYRFISRYKFGQHEHACDEEEQGFPVFHDQVLWWTQNRSQQWHALLRERHCALLMYLGVEQQMLQENLHSPEKKTRLVGSKPEEYKKCARATLECNSLFTRINWFGLRFARSNNNQKFTKKTVQKLPSSRLQNSKSLEKGHLS